MTGETIGRRIYAVRLALGDGWKNPLPGTEFGLLLKKRLRRTYDSAMISRMENGERKVSIEEAAAIASLDPKHRGPAWLAFGETGERAGNLEPQIVGPVSAEKKRASAERRAARKKRNPGRAS